MIREQDISILIPSYRRPVMTAKAVKSALATKAGEIIVSENGPDAELREQLKDIKDDRLKIYSQPQNLGLWRNHHFLINAATKPWIKFLHTDDFISPNCLEKMCEVVTENTAIVCALSISYNMKTMELRKEEVLAETHTWTSEEYLSRLKTVGNELGRPSNILVKASILEKEAVAWDNDKSCDLIMNVMAATCGEVVILPEGLVYIGFHPEQDMMLQSFKLIVKRLRNSLKYLKDKNVTEINDFVRVYGLVELLGVFRIMFSHIKRHKKFIYKDFLIDVFYILRIINFVSLLKERKSIKQYYNCKFNKIKDIVTILPRTLA